MKKILLLAATLWSVSISAQNISTENITKHVYVLASDSLAGRKAGSEGGQKAANYIAFELRKMGLTPIIESSQGKVALQNVICELKGTDPTLENERILIVSHYDHIGQNGDGVIYPGANDNATSNAALLEVVRNWKPTKRSVIFMWSDGEEMGMLGARAYVEKHRAELGNLKLVMASEMLGHLDRTKNVHLLGQDLTVEGADIVAAIVEDSELDIITQSEHPERFLGGTDTAAFWVEGIPVMVWFTDSSENYHKTTDTAQTIDYKGMTLITKYIARSIQKFADSPTITATELARLKIKK